MNLRAAILNTIYNHPNREAIQRNDETYITYGELAMELQYLSEYLLKVVKEGQKVAIAMSHPYYESIGILSCLLLDITIVPLSLSYGVTRCHSIIQDCNPEWIITDGLCDLSGVIIDSIKTGVINIRTIENSGRRERGDFPKHYSGSQQHVAAILYTSGTSGSPKGVMLSAENIYKNIESIDEYYQLKEYDHILIVRSLSHASAFTGELLYCIKVGAKISFYQGTFIPQRIAKYIEHIGCTTVCMTPTLFHKLLSMTSFLKSLKKVALSGEIIHDSIIKRLGEELPEINFFNVYGLTEASPRVTYLEPFLFSRKSGSVGRAIPGVAIRIIDEHGDEVCEPGKVGEVLVKGPNVMIGYWNNEKLTKKKLRDGWLHTGDLGCFDDEMYLTILGRKDDMIIRAGMNIFPREIENVILRNEKVSEVSVWGERDIRYGQKIILLVVPKKYLSIEIKDIREQCRQYLASYQQPDEIYIVKSLPRTSSGKLKKDMKITE